MSDDELRRLERTWRATGAAADEARFKRELERRAALPLVEVTLTSGDDDSLERAGGAMDGALEGAELRDRLDEVARVTLGHAVREALLNAVTHGGLPVTLRARVVEERLEVVVTDGGRGFDHALHAGAAGARPGGLGLFLLRRAFDEVGWNEVGNEVRLVKRLGRRR